MSRGFAVFSVVAVGFPVVGAGRRGRAVAGGGLLAPAGDSLDAVEGLAAVTGGVPSGAGGHGAALLGPVDGGEGVSVQAGVGVAVAWVAVGLVVGFVAAVGVGVAV